MNPLLYLDLSTGQAIKVSAGMVPMRCMTRVGRVAWWQQSARSEYLTQAPPPHHSVLGVPGPPLFLQYS